MAVRALTKLQPLALLVVGPHLWPMSCVGVGPKGFQHFGDVHHAPYMPSA
jgi:hypothetical protein